VGVVGSKTSDVVTVTASATSAERAALLANTYSETARRLAIDDERAEARLALGSLKSQFDKLPLKVQQHVSGPGAQLRNNIQKMQVIADIGNGSPRIIQPGFVPSSKAGNPIQTIILGVLFGMVLGVGLALLREQGDRRLHGVEEASVAFDAPVLSTVPRHRALKRHVPFADLPPEVAEAFRMLQMNLRYGREEPVRSVLITSSRTQEGKTTIAWNLACAGVSAGLDVALVEADMRRPTLAERYDLQPGPGVTEVVEGRTELSDALQSVMNVRGDRHGRKLDVLVAGQLPPDPWAVLQSDAMAWNIETLKQSHGLVVVDTPPIPHVADAVSLLGHVDGVIIAASANATRRQDARRLTEQLRSFDAPILGVVVNGGSAVSGYGYVPSRPPSAPLVDDRLDVPAASQQPTAPLDAD
jgi:capsular exopolysaccharide synthesis family protein